MDDTSGQPQHHSGESSRREPRVEPGTTTSGATPEVGSASTHFTHSERLAVVADAESFADTSVTRRRRRRVRMQALSMLPSMLTLGNGVCGIAAIIELFKAYLQLSMQHHDVAMWHLNLAVILIGGGMVFDGLDGKVARLTNTSGKFGAELDSLCDAITFGLAPGMLMWVFGQYLYGSAAFDTKVLWSVCILYASCAVLRLARFNAETEPDDDHMTFSGMPSPGAACGIVSLFLALSWFSDEFSWMRDEWAMVVLRIMLPLSACIVGLLMVTRIRYVHFMNRLLNKRQSFRSLIFVLLMLAILTLANEYWRLVVPVGVIVYTVSGPVYLGYRFLRGRGVLGRRLQLAERQRQHRERLQKQERAAAREDASK